MIELLRTIRSIPRRMQISYLKKIGVYDYIQEQVPNDFPIRDKIDIILLGEYNKCYCGSLTKPASKWCSLTCMNKDVDRNKIISSVNTGNATSRLSKAKDTLMERYGVDSPQKIPAIKAKTKAVKQAGYKEKRKATFEKYRLDQVILSDHKHLDVICKGSSYIELSQGVFNGMAPMTIYRHFETIQYIPPFEKQTSSGERELCKFLDEHGIAYKTNDREVIKPFELDIFIPEHNLAIEYNGLYWHSRLDKNYHIQKTNMCSEKGVRLLQIFEDEWILKGDIVKSIILAKLGIFKERVHARKTVCQPVDNSVAKPFLEENHIQGSISGKHYGLYEGDRLVILVTIGKCRFSKGYELLRYCSLLGVQVNGGFSKLLSCIKLQYKSGIKTYADLRYSDGKTYYKFGEYSHTSEPSYYWIHKWKLKRINRMQTQKHKLPKLLGDIFCENKTEKENMVDAGYLQVYDCGNLVFTL